MIIFIITIVIILPIIMVNIINMMSIDMIIGISSFSLLIIIHNIIITKSR